jgi:hypothetical protein
MMLSREGAPLMLGTVALGVVLFALALRMRSWPLWLLAFSALVAALCMAWLSRGSTLSPLASA